MPGVSGTASCLRDSSMLPWAAAAGLCPALFALALCDCSTVRLPTAGGRLCSFR